jgi:uncharacterized protein YdhG (YjbR/CyaY superfamily)
MATTKKTGTKAKSYDGFTDAERDAMKERAKELKGKEDPAAAQAAKIAAMNDADRAIAERLQVIIAEAAPELTPKLWYGMPAWAKNGKVLCFFQDAAKFKSRYATFGFDQSANLDDGDLWPTSYALAKLTPAVEKKLIALLKKAVS